MKTKDLRPLSLIAPSAMIAPLALMTSRAMIGLLAVVAAGFPGSAQPAGADGPDLRNSPDYLFHYFLPGPYADGDGNGSTVESSLGEVSALLMTMARAREYPTFNQETSGKARETAGFTCSTAHRDALQDENSFLSIGTKCYTTVTAALEMTEEALRKKFDIPYAGPTEPPVSLSNYVLAAIDLIESEPSFSRYLDPEPISRDGLVHSRGQHGYSGRMIRALANLAAGFSEAGRLPEVRQAAERALVWMIVDGPDEDFDEADDEGFERELSRRNFRADLTGWSWRDSVLPGLVAAVPPHQHAANWLICLYSRVGWGYVYELRASAMGLIRVATIRLKDVDGDGPDTALVSEATRFIQHMGLIQRIALSDGPAGLPVEEKIYLREGLEGQIARIRADDSPENRRFIRIYDDYMNEEVYCGGDQAFE